MGFFDWLVSLFSSRGPKPKPPRPVPPINPRPNPDPGVDSGIDPEPDPIRDRLELVPVSPKRPSEVDGSFYWDVLCRPARKNLDSDRITNAHESAHFLHADLRNAKGPGWNAFYAIGGYVVYVQEPPVRMTQIADHVPRSCRGSRFQLYLVNQASSWDDRSLYVFDEANSYLIGAKVALDDHANGRTLPDRSVIDALPEFAVYASAHVLLVKDKSPSYYEANTQYKAWVDWFLAESWDVYRAGLLVPELARYATPKIVASIVSSPDATAIRDVLTDFGSSWIDTTKRLLL